MSTIPPCVGHHELFDSTHWLDHRRAKAMCDNCPLVAACQQRLEDAFNLAEYGGKPEGTWAGQLIGAHRNSRHLLVEESMFTDAEARAAHAAWARGERDHRSSIGERVYQRRIARNKKKGTAA